MYFFEKVRSYGLPFHALKKNDYNIRDELITLFLRKHSWRLHLLSDQLHPQTLRCKPVACQCMPVNLKQVHTVWC